MSEVCHTVQHLAAITAVSVITWRALEHGLDGNVCITALSVIGAVDGVAIIRTWLDKKRGQQS